MLGVVSYHRRALSGPMPSPVIDPTFAFAQSVDPYTWRASPPGAVFAPYGWGSMNIGMPAAYGHHIDYVRDVPYPHDHLGITRICAPTHGLSGLELLALL